MLPSVTPQDFAEIKNIIKTQNKEIIASNTSKLQEIAKESGKSVSKELGVDFDLNVSKIIPLDPHYESKNSLSFSMYVVSKVSSMGEETEYVAAGTVTLINVAGKVVSLYSLGEQADLKWTQKASQAWANKAIANNI